MEPLNWIHQALLDNPQLAIFLTLGLGYWLGNLKLGTFSLGSVTGVLLVGVLVGQLRIPIASDVKAIFFIMFLFAIGYGVGPQFVRGLGREGLPQVLFSVTMCLIILGWSYLIIRLAGFDLGLGAGMFAGSQTISAAIGLASQAITELHLSAAHTERCANDLPVAYAVTYFFGTLGTGWVLSRLGPRLLRINLREECRAYAMDMSIHEDLDEAHSAWHDVIMRAYRIDKGSALDGLTIGSAEEFFSDIEKYTAIYIERLRRGGKIQEFTAHTILEHGDVVAITGHHETLSEIMERSAVEVEDRTLLSIPMETVDILITKKRVAGETLQDLARERFAHGVFLTKITRGADAVSIPLLARTRLHRADILRVTGTPRHLERIAGEIGYVDRSTTLTDMVFVGLAVFVGGLMGSITVPISGVPITLSTAGGALICGLIMGWLRSVHPTFGRIPAPSLWFMNSVGLNMFIAAVGISAGPDFVDGLKQAGWGLFLWGAAATAVPMILAPLIGCYIFKLHPAIVLGSCCGARTSTPSVGMVKDAARSDIPMLGYTIPYAVSNTLLTLWGLVLILMLK